MENNEKKYVLCKYVQNPKRPYVEFWAYDHVPKKLIRKRKYFATHQIKLAKLFMKGIDKRLLEGFEYNKNFVPSVKSALSMVWEGKVIERKDTKRSYKSHYTQFVTFCEKKGLLNLPINELSKIHIIAYLDESMLEKCNSAKTRNTKMENLRTFFNFLMEREIITKNPCHGIKRLKELQSKSQAIPATLVPIIREAVKKENPTLYLFNSFVYYCFIRPAELLLLEWANIDYKNAKIFVPATISKNGKSEWIVIPKSMMQILNDAYPEGLPTTGKVFAGSHYTTLRHQQLKILKEAGLPKYGLYEWKHTGVTAFFNAGVNIKYIQQQCRHSSLDYTDMYLKGLGLIDNTDAFDDVPAI